ncbi:hypothetical protein FACS1894102_4680 [Spirochaetia bacterium]|nr:hypothetical protein FACS1894102_4680 [Spirochaetia bacterium]
MQSLTGKKIAQGSREKKTMSLRDHSPFFKFSTSILKIILIWIACFFVSCTGLPTANTTQNVPKTAAWQNIIDGVDYTALKIKKPRLKIYAIRINLQNPNIEIAAPVVEFDSDNISNVQQKQNFITATKVSTFAKKNNCIAAINAGPFAKVHSSNFIREGMPLKHVGVLFSDRLIADKNHFDAIIFYKNGTAKIAAQDEITDFKELDYAIGGFYMLLKNGRFFRQPAADTKRHPRSIAGLSDNGNVLYLLAIDGRQLGSVGAALEDAAVVAAGLGADFAINLDGGGSSALAVRKDGKLRIVNTPVNYMIAGKERAVASCIGIRQK